MLIVEWGRDTSSEVKTCRRGDCCADLVDLIEILSVISFRNDAVLVRDRSLKVACFNSGDAGWETDFKI